MGPMLAQGPFRCYGATLLDTAPSSAQPWSWPRMLGLCCRAGLDGAVFGGSGDPRARVSVFPQHSWKAPTGQEAA